MTTPMIDFENDPRYQRAIRKISALTPENRAILDTMAIDETFATDAIRRRLRGLTLRADVSRRQFRREGLKLQKETAKTGIGLRRRAQDLATKERRWGTYISAANIPLAGILGYQRLKLDTARAKQITGLTGRIRRMT